MAQAHSLLDVCKTSLYVSSWHALIPHRSPTPTLSDQYFYSGSGAAAAVFAAMHAKGVVPIPRQLKQTDEHCHHVIPLHRHVETGMSWAQLAPKMLQ
eukprot:2081694-Karenia_brevis.AAC.1